VRDAVYVKVPSLPALIRTPVNVIDIVATASFYLDFIMTQLQRDHDVLEFFRYFIRELDTGQVHPRVGSGRVTKFSVFGGSGWVGCRVSC